MEFTCAQCGKPFEKRPSARRTNGRPRKHTFCTDGCYDRWRADQHLATKSKWLSFQREVWGSTELARHDVGRAKAIGRKAEVLARDELLPREGFTEIVDLSNLSNQFFIDFVATFRGARVLVDATIKLKAYVPDKARLAEALRMPLFIIHVAPKGGLYFLHPKPLSQGASVCRIPAAFIRQVAEKQGFISAEAPT